MAASVDAACCVSTSEQPTTSHASKGRMGVEFYALSFDNADTIFTQLSLYILIS